MKKLFFALTAFAVAVSMGSCEKAAEEAPAAGQPDVTGVMAQVESYMTEHEGTPALDNISEFYIPVDENAVVVGLVNCDEQAVADFRQAVSNSPLLRFVQCDRKNFGFETETVAAPQDIPVAKVVGGGGTTSPVQLMSGDRLYKKDASGAWVNCGTIGYRVKRAPDNIRGFVTIGHTIQLNDELYSIIDGTYTLVGMCKGLQCKGNVNAAFVASAVGVSNQLKTTAYTYNTFVTTTPGTNKSVTIYGGQTIAQYGRATAGEVISFSYSFVGPDNVTYSGLVSLRTQGMSGIGDFGGVVVPWRSSLSGGTAPYSVMGIFSIGMCYVPAGAINSALHLTIF